MDFDKNMLTRLAIRSRSHASPIAIMHGIDTEWPPGGE